MRILALVASPRAGGNTEVLVDRLLKGAYDFGADVEKVMLEELRIHPIRDCRACRERGHGRCNEEDDATALIEKMGKADLTVFATPLYWYGPSAQMKAFMDRWSCNTDEFVARVRGSKGFLLFPRSESDPAVASPITEMFKLVMSFVGMEFVGQMSAIADRRGEIAENQQAMSEAYEWGRRLAALAPERNPEVLCRRGC